MRQTLVWPRLARLLLTPLAITVSAIALPVLAVILISGYVPFVTPQRAMLTFLIAFGIGYAAVLPILLIATPMIRRDIPSRTHEWREIQPGPARGLLLGTSLLIPIGIAELTIGVRCFWQPAAEISALSDAKLPEEFVEQSRRTYADSGRRRRIERIRHAV